MSINALRMQIQKLNDEADNKRKLAQSLQSSAETHLGSGDDVKGATEQQSADRYIQDAELAERQLEDMERELLDRERRLGEIDAELTRLDKDYKSKRDSLEKERSSVAG